jgi:hypothetical protein
MDDFFVTLSRHQFFIPLVLFIKAGDEHLNSTIITFTLGIQVMEGGIACQRQNGSPHVY